MICIIGHPAGVPKRIEAGYDNAIPQRENALEGPVGDKLRPNLGRRKAKMEIPARIGRWPPILQGY